VQETSFREYPLLTIDETPEVETWFVESERAPGGIGEPPIPPLAPAVGNAIFAASGLRLRSLPFVLD
jgi:isoquinoline 1-oxidoreductase beta subunit